MDNYAIRANKLTKYYDDMVLENVSFNVPRGSIYGLLGRNGAGKTTTLKILLGIIQPNYGNSFIFDEDSQRLSPSLKEKIAFVGENQNLYEWMSISFIIKYTRTFYKNWDEAYCQNLLKKFELDPKSKIKTLSPGNRARLALVLAVSPQPELLILDDISSRLDTVVRRQFIESILNVIHQEGRTVIFSSHILTEVERIADRIGIIHKGKLIMEGAIDDLKIKTQKSLEDMFIELTG